MRRVGFRIGKGDSYIPPIMVLDPSDENARRRPPVEGWHEVPTPPSPSTWNKHSIMTRTRWHRGSIRWRRSWLSWSHRSLGRNRWRCQLRWTDRWGNLNVPAEARHGAERRQFRLTFNRAIPHSQR